jgi:rare lipoprotein A
METVRTRPPRPISLSLLASLMAVTFGCSAAQESRSGGDGAAEGASVHEGAVLDSQDGRAAYISQSLDGKKTASGIAFDGRAMVAAHPTYPFDTLLRVTNLANGRQQEVRVVDRGPSSSSRREGVIIDVSRAAADALGFLQSGEADVRVEVLRWGTIGRDR